LVVADFAVRNSAEGSRASRVFKASEAGSSVARRLFVSYTRYKLSPRFCALWH